MQTASKPKMSNMSMKVNPEQKKILFEAMSRHKYILEDRHPTSAMRRLKDVLWKKLAVQLNKNGPAKDTSQWKKCWADLKLTMRKKFLRAQNNGTGKKMTFVEIRACGLEMELNNSETTNVSDDDVNVVENEEINEGQSQKLISTGLEAGRSPEVSRNHDSMTGVINIEDESLFPKDAVSDIESLLLSEEDVESASIPQPVIKQKLKRMGDFQAETLLEIRKMHRNLLRESRKQTALLKKIVNRLGR